ncbi:MAG: 16S rRNA (uracil(1498)-N(3))-methyltransferase [Coriobacteriales bacterium]|jgi:16S rRNA (uracil1498-N3)-methyltransferase|nr:16S rRNA (uracil(1498)-N(3))-methyltransferase [Coriobacteriales bacterium]
MSVPHLFVQDESDVDNRNVPCQHPQLRLNVGEQTELALPEDSWQHLRALRLRAGERLVLVDAPGHSWELLLAADLGRSGTVLKAEVLAEHHAARRHRLTLVQGISAAARMDQTVRQVTELGVARIIPLRARRSTVRLNTRSAAEKTGRWQRLARAAAEQSSQLFLPQISQPLELEVALDALPARALLLFFWEEADAKTEPFLRAFPALLAKAAAGRNGGRFATIGVTELSVEPEVVVLVGPEGGFSSEEAVLIKARGGIVASLGPTILRTETAAVVACALVLHCLEAHGA